jgi:hypothetical protein
LLCAYLPRNIKQGRNIVSEAVTATQVESKLKTEAEVFDILAGHGIEYVTGHIATDSRDYYAGWLIEPHDGVYL